MKIEIGRYRNERKCDQCQSGFIEDEIHFISCYSNFSQERDILFKFISDQVQNLSLLGDEGQFIYLMSSEDKNTLNAVGKFIRDGFN